MAPIRHQGKLRNWNDEKGFGFIEPESGGKQVFLHISEIAQAARRPESGDTILYELKVHADGKLRAFNASISGVASRRVGKIFTRRHRRLLETAAGVAILTTAAFFAVRSNSHRAPHSTAPQMDSARPPGYLLRSENDRASDSTAPQMNSAPPPGYVIKGNISIDTGDRIYHVPGSEDYQATRIDLTRGERWFRSEAEAVESGWRRAPR